MADSVCNTIYLKLWWTNNIGNAFINMGSIFSLKKAIGDNSVTPISIAPLHLREINKPWIRMRRKLKKIFSLNDKKKDSSPITELISSRNPDYIVISGMVLAEGFIHKTGTLLKELRDKGMEIIINGGGGQHYSKKERETVRKFLNRIKPLGLITRDKKSYDFYHDLARFSHNGIDLAFFVSDIVENVPRGDYTVATFDRKEEPKFSKGKKIIQVNHSCLPSKTEDGEFFSDSPMDYLYLYSWAEEVHADRMHACIPSLSLGTPCKYYFESPKKVLFDRMEVSEIENKTTTINQDLLEREKRKHIEALKRCFHDGEK